MSSLSIRKLYTNFLIAIKGTETNFTSGSIRRAIFLLSVPMILEMVMESLFAIVDVFFVAKVGTHAVAAVGLTESVLTIIYSVAMGLSMAATALVARRVGEGDPQRASNAAFQAIALATGASILISAFGVWFAKDILRFMGGEETLVQEGYRYTRIMFGSNIVIMLLFLINGIFRGAGDASLAMRALWIANGINILLDPVLILGLGPVPALGLEGAAIATTIGRSAGVLYQVYNLLSRRSVIKIGFDNMVLRGSTLLSIVRIALGSMGQFLVESASWIFLVRILSEFGSEVLAGYTISIRIIIFSILPSWGMANAAATLVGQNLGAAQPGRAEVSVWRTAFYNLIFLVLLAVLFYVWAYEFVGLFSSDPRVVENGVLSLRIICLGYAFVSYGMVVAHAFNGAGDTRTPLIINLFCYWLIQIPLAYFLAVPLHLGPKGVYISVAISFSIAAVVSIVVFKKGRWKQIKV